MVPITSVDTMRKSDAQTISGGVSGMELMMRAGKGIFESYPWQGPVCVVCGYGNNAGDGYVLALLLQEAGIDCRLLLLDERFSQDGRYYFERCMEAGIPSEIYSAAFDFSPYTELADCIFGTGFSGEVRGVAAEVIERMNGSGKIIVSADINSGLDGDSGLGSCCVRSDLTVSIGCYQTGHFLNQAKDLMKKRRNIDIGIHVPDEGRYLVEGTDFSSVLSRRPHFSHKGDYGYVTVMGGCAAYSGAVKLANMSASALRAGCGVAQLAVPQSIAASVAPYLLESTLLSVPTDEEGFMRYCPEMLDTLLSRQAALAVGMGWGRGKEYPKILTHLLQKGTQPLIIDADGLNTLAGMDLLLLKESGAKVVLTPHMKEFERLSGIPVAQLIKCPIPYAEAFAREYGVCLLLKGTCTVVTDGTVTYLVDRGCAGMATAGSGDVLSGILAGLLGYAPFGALSVACGAYLAGRAGELAEAATNSISMTASDTVAHITEAVSELL